MSQQGRSSEAEESLRTALGEYEKLLASDPTEAELLARVSNCLENLGGSLVNSDQPEEAEGLLLRALAMKNDLAGNFPNVPRYRGGAANVHRTLGVLYLKRSRLEDAIAQYSAEVNLLEGLSTEYQGNREYHERLVKGLNHFRDLLNRQGASDSIEENFARSIVAYERWVSNSPDIPEIRAGYAMTQANYGGWLISRGQVELAVQPFRNATTEQEHVANDRPENLVYRQRLAEYRNVLGAILQQTGQYEASKEQLLGVVSLGEAFVSQYPGVAEYQVLLGGAYCNLGLSPRNRMEATDCLIWFGKAVSTLEAAVELEPTNRQALRYLSNSYASRATILDDTKEYAQAVADWSRLIELSPPSAHPGYRAKRAESRLKAGMEEEAAKDVDAISSLSIWQAEHRYIFASIYAMASDKAGVETSKQVYASKAVEMLREAAKAGWKPSQDPTADPNLAAARDRDDFRELAAEYGWGQNPAQPKN